MAPIVIGTNKDSGLQADAEAMGATFLLEPTSSQELLAAVLRTIWRRPADKPIRRPFERRAMERRGTGAAGALASERRRRQDRRGTVQRLMRPDMSSYGS